MRLSRQVATRILTALALAALVLATTGMPPARAQPSVLGTVTGLIFPTNIAISPDGRFVVTGGVELRVYERLESGRLRLLHTYSRGENGLELDTSVLDLAFTPNGELLIVVGFPQPLFIYSVNADTGALEIEEKLAEIEGLGAAGQGEAAGDHLLLSGFKPLSNERTVLIFRRSDGEASAEGPAPSTGSGRVVSPDQSSIFELRGSIDFEGNPGFILVGNESFFTVSPEQVLLFDFSPDGQAQLRCEVLQKRFFEEVELQLRGGRNIGEDPHSPQVRGVILWGDDSSIVIPPNSGGCPEPFFAEFSIPSPGASQVLDMAMTSTREGLGILNESFEGVRFETLRRVRLGDAGDVYEWELDGIEIRQRTRSLSRLVAPRINFESRAPEAASRRLAGSQSIVNLYALSSGSGIVGGVGGGSITELEYRFEATSCLPSATTACLGGMAVSAEYTGFSNNTGPARVVQGGSSDSGLFWFFDENNWELLVKVLDGCPLNGHHWVFAAGTTNAGVVLTVQNPETGDVVSYENPLGENFSSVLDTRAMPCEDPGAPATALTSERRKSGSEPRPPELPAYAPPPFDFATLGDLAGGACADSDTGLCLSPSRFLVEVEWEDFQGSQGSGQVVPLRSADSGLFWFFDATNWEMLVKVVDGCALNQRRWVFAAATTNVGFVLTVTDTFTGAVRQYVNELGEEAQALADTDAFACD